MIFKFTIDLVSGFPDQHKSYSKSIRCVTIDDEIKGLKLDLIKYGQVECVNSFYEFVTTHGFRPLILNPTS